MGYGRSRLRVNTLIFEPIRRRESGLAFDGPLSAGFVADSAQQRPIDVPHKPLGGAANLSEDGHQPLMPKFLQRPWCLPLTWPSPRRYEVALVSALLLALFCQLFFGSVQMGLAYDELFHIPAGVAWVDTGQRRSVLEHLPLGHLLAGWSLQALEPTYDRALYFSERIQQSGFEFGNSFFMSNQRQIGLLLLVARFPFMVSATVGALYVYLLSRSLWGTQSALFSLVLCAFCPGLIGWSRFVYLDGLLATCSIAALSHLCWLLRSRHPAHLAALSFWFAATLGAKYSGLYLVPIVGTALLVPPQWFGERAATLRRRLLDGAVVSAVSGLFLWAAFGFPHELGFYVKGASLLYNTVATNHRFYLHGDFQLSFWHFYLVQWLIKSTLPCLLLTAASLGLAAYGFYRGRGPEGRKTWWPLAVLLGAATGFLVLTSAKSIPIGFRYLLPMYPPLYVAAGALLREIRNRKRRFAERALWALAVWHAMASLAVFPDQMGYFNEAVGGSSRGIFWAVDASLDAGQNLPRLARYLAQRGNPPVKLLYQGTDVPERYGIKTAFFSQAEWDGLPTPGLYAISSMPLAYGQLTARQNPQHLDWLNKLTPATVIGNSIWVYEIRDRRTTK